MKRFKKFLLLCSCVAVLGSLTACGSTNSNPAQTTTDDTTKDDESDGISTMNGATDGSAVNDTTMHENSNGNVLDDVTDGLTDAVDDTADGIDRTVEDATRGQNTTNGTAENGTATDNANVQETKR